MDKEDTIEECMRGHKRNEKNTYIHPSKGTKHCRLCRAEDGRKHRKESKGPIANIDPDKGPMPL